MKLGWAMSLMLAGCWSVAARQLPAATDPPAPDSAAVEAGSWLDWLTPEMARLRTDAARLQRDLAELPPYTPQEELRGGYHTRYSSSPDVTEWVQVDLGAELPFDKLVLCPVYIRQNEQFITGYGFPRRFRLEAASEPEFRQPVLLADFTREDHPDPGRYPLQVETPGGRGRYVRLTITRLATRDQQNFAAIGELLVLSGNRNIALWRPVYSSSSIEADLRWSAEYLVDEFSLLPAPLGPERSPTDGYLCQGSEHLPHTITLDLGQVFPVEEIRLCPAEPRETASVPGWGFPSSFRIELSETPDFSPSVLLLDFTRFELRHWTDRRLIVPSGSREFFHLIGISLRNPPEPPDLKPEPVPARYVRITVTATDPRLSPPLLALAEVQVYAGGNNVARNSTVQSSGGEVSETGPWSRDSLVDGYSSRHELIELPVWLEQIELRSRYEQALERTTRELQQAEATFAARVRRVGGSLLAVVLAGLLGGFLYQRWRVRQETARLRERIASDLHDDIGSNLGTITLLSEALQRLPQVPQPMQPGLKEISQIAKDTSDAMRDMLWIIRPAPLSVEEFVSQLRQVAVRMLGTYQLTTSAPSVFADQTVDMVWRRNVFLSFKELLRNIQRHSQATTVALEIQLQGRLLSMTLTNDGLAFDAEDFTRGHGLANIRKRMAELKGTIEYRQASSAEPHWTRLTVSLP